MFRPFALAALAGWAMAAPALADYAKGLRAWAHADYAAAAREFLPAAQAGDAESQYMMGRLCALGDGVPKDFVQAWVWFDRAARQGHTMAAEGRDTMQYVLNPSQLAAARALAVPPPAARAAPQVAAAPPPEMIRPEHPIEGRPVVLVPRRGVVAAPQPTSPPAASDPATAAPARLVAPGATEEGRLLARGDLPGQVREVQHALRRAGYYSGPANGVLGPPTRMALRQFQHDTGLPETGLMNVATIDRLLTSDQQQAAR